MQIKALLSISLIATACLSASAFAGTGRMAGKTDCYIFKNDKLVKKAQCSYEYYQSGNMSGATEAADFNVKGYGKIDFLSSIRLGEPDSNGEAKEEFSITEVNKKPAIYQTRDVKTLKVIPDTMNNTAIKAIECYKQLGSNLEICYVDIYSGKPHN